jgi:hypothetical protein
MDAECSFHLKPAEDVSAHRWPVKTLPGCECITIQAARINAFNLYGTPEQIGAIEAALAASYLRRALKMPDTASDTEVLLAVSVRMVKREAA